MNRFTVFMCSRLFMSGYHSRAGVSRYLSRKPVSPANLANLLSPC